MELIAMSERDLQRIEVLSKVIAGRMTLGDGSACFHLSTRQTRRRSCGGPKRRSSAGRILSASISTCSQERDPFQALRNTVVEGRRRSARMRAYRQSRSSRGVTRRHARRTGDGASVLFGRIRERLSAGTYPVYPLLALGSYLTRKRSDPLLTTYPALGRRIFPARTCLR
jgi:hypothetical protein